ncbi:MAG: anti-sigma factor antagonist [Phycisphaeraceae bacterium]|nr:MAG: anti-sigma factor antagonist [Phycisphaeraceae bacterium]
MFSFSRQNSREAEQSGARADESPIAVDESADSALPAITSPSANDHLATLERLGNSVVVTITVTELSGGDAMTLMADLLEHVESAGVRHFVFDLQSVNYMDSSCIGAMVEMLTRLQTSGGRIALVNAGQSVSYLFRLTRLDRVFPICRDVMTAISALERGPNPALQKKGRKR